MRVSRYEHSDNHELYCTFHLSQEELDHLGQPEYVRLKVKDGVFIVTKTPSSASDALRLGELYKGERRFQIFASVFPGTKTFGIEEVVTVFHGAPSPSSILGQAYLEALFPEMATPVRKVLRGQKREKVKIKVDALSKLSDADLVRALNTRILSNPMWRPKIKEDRTLTIEVQGTIA